MTNALGRRFKQQLFKGQQFFHNKWLNLGLSRLYSERLCCKNFFPSIFVATNFRGNVRFSNPCVEENEDQSRRLARGWSMVMAQFPRYRLPHLGRKLRTPAENARRSHSRLA